jgi:hypothetical protein
MAAPVVVAVVRLIQTGRAVTQGELVSSRARRDVLTGRDDRQKPRDERRKQGVLGPVDLHRGAARRHDVIAA